MALVDTGHMLLGLPAWGFGSGGSQTLDAAGERFAMIFEVPTSGTIDRLTIRTNAVTTPQPLRVGLYTLDASGNATATLYGGSAPGVLAAPAAVTTAEVTLATPATAVAGDMVAAVVEFDAATGNLSLFTGTPSVPVPPWGMPHVQLYTAAWALVAAVPLLGVRYSSGSYATIGAVPGSILNGAQNTLNDIGNLWVPSVPCRVCGYWVSLDLDTDASVQFLDADGTTVLATSLLPTVQRGSTAQALFTKRFTPPLVVLAGSTYRLVVRVTGGGTVVKWEVTVLSAAALDGLPLGQFLSTTQRAGGGGAWTNTPTQRYGIGPIIDQIAVGGGPLVGGRLT